MPAMSDTVYRGRIRKDLLMKIGKSKKPTVFYLEATAGILPCFTSMHAPNRRPQKIGGTCFLSLAVYLTAIHQRPVHGQ